MTGISGQSADGTAPEAVEQRRGEPLSTLLTAAVGVLFIVCFAPYLRWMWEIWMKSEYYGHGPLVPLISGYLIYTRRREFVEAEDGHNWVGLLAMALGLLVYATSIYLDVNFTQGFSMVLVLAGLIVWLWGWGRARVIAFPIAFLLFMVPTGRLLVTQFSNPLQVHAAAVAAAVARFIGLPVLVRGTTIMIPDYTFEVAQACSGLKSAIAMTALAALFSYAVEGPLWKRVTLFVMGIPVALAANSIRITLTLFLGRAFGSAAAEGFFHDFSGILVFLLGLVGLFGVAKVLRCDRMRDDIL